MVQRTSSCLCGMVRCVATGSPIVSAVCYCASCQSGARAIEALAGAPRIREADGGTALLTFRDDRFAIIAGEDQLVAHRLSPGAPTRRMVARCCNSAMFLKYEPGFWVSTYRTRFAPEDWPPVEMRNQIRHRDSPLPLPDEAPAFQGFPLRLFWALAKARVAMLLGR